MDRLPKLNLGCGLDAREGFINADIVALPGVDVVCDLDQLWPWKDSTAGYIVAAHVFEHVTDPVKFMTEAHRVLVAEGVLDIRCPYYRHPNAFTDPTHRRFATEHMWDYWIRGTMLNQVYGPGMGAGQGGAEFKQLRVGLNGNDGAEVQIILVKL